MDDAQKLVRAKVLARIQDFGKEGLGASQLEGLDADSFEVRAALEELRTTGQIKDSGLRQIAGYRAEIIWVPAGKVFDV